MDPKTPKIAGGDKEGKSPEDEDDFAEPPVTSESSAEGGARNEARSAQLFLPLSEIAWYIAGVIYSNGAIYHLSKQGCYIAGLLQS